MRILATAKAPAFLLALAACSGSAAPDDSFGEAREPLVANWTAIGGTTDAGPSPVVFLGRMYHFVKGVMDKQVWFRSSSDATTWSGWSSLTGLTTNVELTPVVFGNTLYVFAIQASDNNFRVNKTTNGTSWTGWSQPFTGTSDRGAAAAVFNGKLFVMAKGVIDNGVRVLSSTNGTSWGMWSQSLGTTNASLSAAVLGNKLVLFIKGMDDNQVWFTTSTDGSFWSAWTPTSGFTFKGPRASVFAGDLYVTVAGTDSKVYTRLAADLTKWSDWFEVPNKDLRSINADFTSGQAVGSAGPFGRGLFWFASRATDNAITVESTYSYRLPFDDGANWSVISGNFDDPVAGHGHTPGSVTDQAYAYDFQHTVGGHVLAMRSGTIMYEDDTQSCMGPGCLGNNIWILHNDGTRASYNHLAQGGNQKPCGTFVAAGEWIGVSGNTGNTNNTPHLHVDVRQYDQGTTCSIAHPDQQGTTIPIYFHDNNHAQWRPRVHDALSPSP
jgi:murein DD-endopeptidase MepM/ murein hydrolase activator NlpD